MPSELAHFYSRTRAARKVIVVDLGFLGDTVHLIPALWELKTAYANASLHVLTSSIGAQVLRLAPCVERAWAVEMQREKRSLLEQWRIVRALRRERFDVAYNFSGADRTLFMSALTGARWRVAYPGARRHFWNAWLIPNWIPAQEPNGIVFEQRRLMLAACGVPLGKVRFDLEVDPVSSDWAAAQVHSPAIHLSPNASKPTREWPIEQHAAMLRAFWDKHPEIPVIASSDAQPRQRQRLQTLAGTVQDERLKLMPEHVTISQLAAVLKRCRLHVGPDSGVLHLAMALGIPTVSLFREQGAYRSFMPTGPQHRVIRAPCHCVDESASVCEKLGRGECMAGIQPLQVLQLMCEELEALR